MVSEYRFLRFEIDGLATLIVYAFVTLPVAWPYVARTGLSSPSVSIAAVASLFLASVPLGYWEHQLVVNRYRSYKRPRQIHNFMKKLCEEELAKLPGPTTKTLTGLINPGQEIPFLTTMTETCISSGKLGTSADIYDRLSDRWSHFYARKAVGILSPLVALILFGVTIIVAAAYQLPFGWQNWWISLVFLTIATILNLVFIYPYSGKILAEINFLEMQVVLANLESVRKIIASILTSAEMYKQFLKM